MPGYFEVQTATRQSHPHVAWHEYDRVRQVMEGAGFRWVADVDPVSLPHDPALSHPNVLRIFVSNDGVMVAGFYRMALRWTFGGIMGRLMGGGRGIVDVSSAFTDGTVLETSSAPLVGKWQSPPFLRREYQPQMHPAALVARHAQRVGEQMEWNPAAHPCRVQTLDEVVAITDVIERKKREHRQSIGWITRDELAAHGAQGEQLDKLEAIVRRIVAEEAAIAVPFQSPDWAAAAPPCAAAASTFVATPPVPPAPPPAEAAREPISPTSPEITTAPAAPADHTTAASSAAGASSSDGPTVSYIPPAEKHATPPDPPPPDVPAFAAGAIDIEPALPDAHPATGAEPGARQPRPLEEVIGRALVMNALVNVHFRAPVEVVRRWVEANGVAEHLSPRERALLAKPNVEVTPQERAGLRGYIEGLWALLWAGSVSDDLSPKRGVPPDMAALVPSLKKNEDASILSQRMRLRSADELSRMLELYEDQHATIKPDLSPADYVAWIEQRRKVIAWVLNRDSPWDVEETR
ncbi:MAG TPA: DUF4272 domain-containing protein [Longimicrobium sp.]|nr:DUF4272 domain-containing protein [Longimicrobium sp.]